MKGTEKQIKWAEDIKKEFLKDLNLSMELLGSKSEEYKEKIAKVIKWVENIDSAEDLIAMKISYGCNPNNLIYSWKIDRTLESYKRMNIDTKTLHL